MILVCFNYSSGQFKINCNITCQETNPAQELEKWPRSLLKQQFMNIGPMNKWITNELYLGHCVTLCIVLWALDWDLTYSCKHMQTYNLFRPIKIVGHHWLPGSDHAEVLWSSSLHPKEKSPRSNLPASSHQLCDTTRLANDEASTTRRNPFHTVDSAILFCLCLWICGHDQPCTPINAKQNSQNNNVSIENIEKSAFIVI